VEAAIAARMCEERSLSQVFPAAARRSAGTADGERIDAHRGLTDADRDRLAFLAAGPYTRCRASDPLPTMLTLVSTSGPLPISVAPFTGAPILPFSIR